MTSKKGGYEYDDDDDDVYASLPFCLSNEIAE
jgi:hypothetical protein